MYTPPLTLTPTLTWRFAQPQARRHWASAGDAKAARPASSDAVTKVVMEAMRLDMTWDLWGSTDRP